MILVSNSATQTHALGAALANRLRPNDIVLLTGELGAGKTQLAQGVAQGLGISDVITSPTFNLVLIHEGAVRQNWPEGVCLHHFDLYRLESAAELDDIDYWALLETGAVSLVEWGDRFTDALPESYLQLDFEIEADEKRRIKAIAKGSRANDLLKEWLAELKPGDAIER